MAIENEGSPSNWMLRFKNGRTTIFLYTEPLTTFKVLKAELLAAIDETYPRGLPKGPAYPGQYLPVPKSISEVVLGIALNPNDFTKGWTELKLAGNADSINDTPKGCGLKDCGVVAFKFRSADDMADEDAEIEEDFEVEWPSFDDDDDEEAVESDEQMPEDEAAESDQQMPDV